VALRTLLIPIVVCATLPVAASQVAAQSIGEAIPGRSAGKSTSKPWDPSAAPRPCPEYGPGFVRVDGSRSCVRVGGSVAVEYGVGSGGRTGSAASGAVQLETRSQTDLGPVRTVLQARGRIDRGLESSPYGYR